MNAKLEGYKIHLLYGVRNNKEEWLFEDFLRSFFSKFPQCHLYLACSRDLFENVEKPNNIHFFKGHVQDVVPELRKIVEMKPKILLCGNKSALGKEVFETMIEKEMLTKENI